MTAFRHTPAGRGRAWAAFTLVEMLITIAVIAVLAALTVSASVVLVQKSEIRQTENVLRLLDLAVQEWESQSDRTLTWGQPGLPPGAVYEMNADTLHVFTTSEVLRTIGRSSQVRPIIAQIDADLVHTYDSTLSLIPPWVARIDPDDPDQRPIDPTPWDGDLAVLDAWGLPVRAVHPGRVANANIIPGERADDPDRTIRQAHEVIYGVAKNRRVGFVSAGPDGKFGSLDPNASQAWRDQAEDNIYSYPLDQP